MWKPLTALVLTASVCLAAESRDVVFSGPQPGERTTPFTVFDATGPSAGKEVDLVAEYGGAPTTWIFVHGLERSMFPLMRAVDQYAADHADALKSVLVFLTDDRLASERRLPIVQRSWNMHSPWTISVDGLEGPGNYGLNKKCLLSIIVAKGDRVTANFALIQPGIADGERVIAAMAAAIGDEDPPSAEDLAGRQGGRNRGGQRGRQRANAMRARSGRAMQADKTLDLSQFDLETSDGLRDAVKALAKEVVSLRRELTELRGTRDGDNRRMQRQRAQGARRPAGKTALPGAAPTDTALISLLRAFIQRSNDDPTVDRVIKDVEAYVEGNEDLTKQAIGGWTRVLHLEYGTDYAHQAGRAMLERLKKP